MAPPFITAATLFDVVAARAATSGATRALTFVDVDSGGRFHADHRTYDELRRSACALAGWLRKQGVRRGDTFAVMMANHPEFVEAMLATALTGAVMVPIDPRTMGDKLSYMLAFTACKGIICTADCAAAVAGLSPDGPRLDWALIVGGASASMPRIAPVCSDFAAARADTDCARVVDADDPMMLMFTSGTTGRPKAVVLSHGAYTGRARAMSAIAPEEGDILYTGLSLTHINAQGTLRLGLTAGLPVVFSRRFTRSQLWPICRAYRCTIFSILGGMIPEIYSLPESDEDIDNPVRLIISAGMPAALWTEFERRYGVKIYEIYGSTEGGGALVNPPGSGPIGSLGKPPPGLEAGVFDEAGRRCPPGRAGELRFRREDGAPTAITYYKDPAASDAKVVDGWFRTGDIAYADRDGWFFFCHRAGGGIRRDGDFINASIVEAALMKSKLLSDVFVYGVTTPRNVAGEKTLVAAVVARDPGLDLDGLREFCRAALQKRDVPEIFQVLDQIPKTISEKPIEAACIAMLRERGLV